MSKTMWELGWNDGWDGKTPAFPDNTRYMAGYEDGEESYLDYRDNDLFYDDDEDH